MFFFICGGVVDSGVVPGITHFTVVISSGHFKSLLTSSKPLKNQESRQISILETKIDFMMGELALFAPNSYFLLNSYATI